MAKIKFDVLIDCGFAEICNNPDLTPIENNSLLSIYNDFEEGKWRHERFLEYIWNNIAETALSKKERESLLAEPLSLLKASAKNLRLLDKDERGKGSEISEILLYGILKDYYNALPVVPKIFYKQNRNDNAKGADSVHLVLTDDMSDFSVWFGEAKFYKSLSTKVLDDIVKSVEHSLDKDKIKKENSIITNLRDLDSFELPDDLKNRIYNLLDQDRTIDALKPKLHIPILLLHQYKNTTSFTHIDKEYLEEIKTAHINKANEYFAKQTNALKDIIHQYELIHFHLILFPVPDKDAIVNDFLNLAAIYRK